MKYVSSRITLTVALAGVAMFAFAGTSASASSPRTGGSASSYTCTAVTPKGTFSSSVTATFTGTTPPGAGVGDTVSISGFQAHLVVPGSLLNEAYSEGVRSVTAGVSAFDISATDATTSTMNIVKNVVKVGTLKLAAANNPSLNVSIPRNPVKVGGWVANEDGTMTFTPGNATFQFKTHAGGLSVQCTTSSTAPISSTTVS